VKSIEAVNKKIDASSKVKWKDTFSKNVILSMFKRITIGHLTVEDSGEVYSFGEPKESATIIAHIQVLHPSAYRLVLFGGTIGSGEAYMLRTWQSSNLVDVVRLMVLNQHDLANMDSRWSWLSNRIASVLDSLRINTKSGSKKHIAAHYDLSNDFFSLFLDESMMYSSAIYTDKVTTLAEASTHKLEHICRRLDLKPTDHLVEIGSGWGGMAIHAAQHFGCKVTTTTISTEQYEFAKEKIERLGLSDQITLLKEDYRDLTGTFDKLVSIEMIEAVGHKYFDTFFAKCSSLLKSNGKMLVQAIMKPDQRYEREKNDTDFIRTYIFPGGCLPSNMAIHESVSRVTDLHSIGLEDITLSYAKTLHHWREYFWNNIEKVKALGFDDRFIHMWDFYLCFCEGGFQERVIHTSQYLFAKPDCRSLPVIQ